MGPLITPSTREYGVNRPVAFARMPFCGTAPDLAAAICKAGGIGAIAAGPLPASAVRELIRTFRDASDSPRNVDFITFLCQDGQLQVCIDEQAPSISFHWGREFDSSEEQVPMDIDGRRCIGTMRLISEDAAIHKFSSFVPTPPTEDDTAPLPLLARQGVGRF